MLYSNPLKRRLSTNNFFMAYGGIISLCIHCGEKVGVGAKFCGQCGKADGRREMDANNTKLFAEKGLVYHCDGCDRRVRASQFPGI